MRGSRTGVLYLAVFVLLAAVVAPTLSRTVSGSREARNLSSAAGGGGHMKEMIATSPAAPLASPVVGMAVTPDGHGYWLVSSDGAVRTFGDAPFLGSAATGHATSPVVGMAVTPDGHGYWLVSSDGAVRTFGDAPFLGSALDHGRLEAVAADTSAHAYLLVERTGQVLIAHSTASAKPNASSAPRGSTSIVALPGASTSDPTTTTTDTASSATAPTGSAPTGSAPTGSAPTATASSANSYTFLYPNGHGGSLARWNPCAPIDWAVNLSDAPPFALADAQAAVAEVSAATGIQFVYVGQTDVVPDPQSSVGNLPPGIDAVIAWLHPSQFQATDGQAGLGGSWWVPGPDGQNVITEGFAIVNGSLAGTLLQAGFEPGYSDGRLLLHELGHMMGLGHTQDETQIMFPSQDPLGPLSYGAGDLAGLKILGSGGCL